MTLFLLTLFAIITSIISAIIGMGGGVLLLSLMTFVLPYHVIIPIHGIVQFISNSSRAFMLAKSVRWDYVGYFSLGAPFGFTLAYFILKSVQNTELYYLLLSLFILYVIFKPKSFPEIRLEGLQWTILGFASALLGSLIGATGPLIAVFYVRSDLVKEEIISTKATQQLIIHLLKIPLFLSLSFDYLEFGALIGAMSLAAIVGTTIGVKILTYVDNNLFRKIFKSVLFIAAIRLMYKFGVTLL